MKFSKFFYTIQQANFVALVAGLVMLGSILGSSQNINAQENTSVSGIDREAIENIVREYLLKNPELMLEVQSALEAKQSELLASQQKETLAQSKEQIFNTDYQIEIGNPDAKTTVVEFFDYNCGFCQRALADMQQLLDADDDIRFILKEFPVLGEGSVEASRVSMAVSKIMPEKHAEFHIALLGLDGVKDGNRAMELATEMGADQDKLIVEMESPSIISALQSTYEIANELGITGTPSYIVGDQVVFGAVGVDELKTQISGASE